MERTNNYFLLKEYGTYRPRNLWFGLIHFYYNTSNLYKLGVCVCGFSVRGGGGGGKKKKKKTKKREGGGGGGGGGAGGGQTSNKICQYKKLLLCVFILDNRI